MTSVEVRCPHCDSSYRVSSDAVGKSGRCKRCGESFLFQEAVDTLDSAQSDTSTGGAVAGNSINPLPKKVGRFEIKEKLGEGGFGTVYRARDPILERQVALKVPHPHLLKIAEDRQRYLREAKTAARLRHAHIVPLFEATINGDDLYIASAFIDGKPLDAVLRERRPGMVEAVGWVIKLARALDYAHGQGVIHRDVKSGNIMLDEHGEPLLMDFGLARIIASDEQLTQTDSVLGTPAYMSPEQAAGRIHEISPATDQYSLGVLLYELISGQRPFTGPIGLVISLVINTPPPPPSEHDPSIPVELETICLRMMSKQIGERYQSLGDVAVELERYLKNRRDSAIASGMRASPPPSDRSADRGSSRPSWRPFHIFGGLGKRRLIAVVGVAAMLVVISGAITLAISVALSLGEKRQLAVNFSVIDQAVDPVEPAVVNQAPSPAASPSVVEPATEVANDATIDPAPVSQASVPAMVTPPAVPDSVPQSQPATPAEQQSQPASTGGTPQLAVAPFSESEAKSHQSAWSGYLGQPVELTNSIDMKLMLIPPGEFMMGSPEDEADRRDSELEHRVRITKPYYLGMYEVTQGEYERVMGTNPSCFSVGGNGSDKIAGMGTSRFPVESVSWEDAVEYCRRLSALPVEIAAGRVYRLPTEAEWEYACRAGMTTPIHFGSQLTSQQANFDGNFPYGITTSGPYLERTATVGSYEANGYGLFDMHGNVWEWCSDWYGDYTPSAQVGPLGAATGLSRVSRGGGWYDSGRGCRSASRSRLTPDYRIDLVGFRVVLSSVVELTGGTQASASIMASPPIEEAAERITLQRPVTPKLAIAPFSASEAKSHQLAWSGYLGQPVELTNSIDMKLMLIPPGEFMMGSPEDEADRDDDELAHRVRITQPYYLGMHEVTQGEYERVMGTNPSWFAVSGNGSDKTTGMDTSRFPVEQVSWEDAVEYCRRLSALPAELAAGRVYRLPTEAEWEYACRAGTTTPIHFGSQLTSHQANFDGNYPYGVTTSGPYLERTVTVGSYEANGYGLFDVHGNVREWCSDWYGEYSASAQVDPLGAATGSYRVNRGGGWYVYARICRSAFRGRITPGPRDGNLGFRVALSSVVETSADVQVTDPTMASPPTVAEITSVPPPSQQTPPAMQQSQPASTGVTRVTPQAQVVPQAPVAPQLAIAPFTETEAKSHQLAWSDYLDQPVELTNSIDMKLMLIPPGEFMMGSPEDEAERSDDEIEHRVRITKPYYLGMHEVTQGEYERVMSTYPSRFVSGIIGRDKITGFDMNRFPVEQVSWDNAIEYCRRLSALPAERAAGRIYRLPTEAEWEYACRAGTMTPFHFGSQLTGKQANFDGNFPYGITTSGPYLERTATVGSYSANGYGLFDMHGNVWEWCSDWYGDYSPSAQVDPLGAATSSGRVFRGGGWFNGARGCRSANRSGIAPENRNHDVGFRVALSSVVER